MYDHGYSHGWLSDTHPDALRVWLDIQRRLTPEQKLRQVVEMYEFITAAQTAAVRRRYPKAAERQVFLRVTARRLGPELMKKAYGWDSGEWRRRATASVLGDLNLIYLNSGFSIAPFGSVAGESACPTWLSKFTEYSWRGTKLTYFSSLSISLLRPSSVRY